MKFFATIILIQLTSCVYAGVNPIEKAKADFKKVDLVYSATSMYSVDIQYSVFDNHSGGNLVEQKYGQYFKNKNLSYTKILNIETIVNTKITIVANNEDKVLVIADTRKIELSPIQTNIDTLLKLCDNIKIQDIGVTERYYSLDFGKDENTEFSKIDIYINLSNYSIKKLVMFYNETMPLTQNDYYGLEKKPRLEIVYKTFTPMSKANELLFSESTYLNVVDNQYKGKGKYSGYKIMNQLQSVRFKKK